MTLLEVFATAMPRPGGLENEPSYSYKYNHAPNHMTKKIWLDKFSRDDIAHCICECNFPEKRCIRLIGYPAAQIWLWIWLHSREYHYMFMNIISIVPYQYHLHVIHLSEQNFKPFGHRCSDDRGSTVTTKVLLYLQLPRSLQSVEEQRSYSR